MLVSYGQMVQLRESQKFPKNDLKSLTISKYIF